MRTLSGAKYYSVELSENCVQRYTIRYRKDGVIILGKYKWKVYCLMEHAGGGWVAFRRRFDGSDEFKYWFGDQVGEYYLGNELLHFDRDYFFSVRHRLRWRQQSENHQMGQNRKRKFKV